MHKKYIHLFLIFLVSPSCTEELEIRSLSYTNSSTTLKVGEGFVSDAPEVDGDGTLTFSFADVSINNYEGITIADATGIITVTEGNTLEGGNSYVIDVSVSNEVASEIFQRAFAVNILALDAIAEFSFSENANDPYALDFINTSQNAVSYVWDFGDGSTSTEENPSYTYASSGEYEVVLTATNGDGFDDEYTETICVADLTGTYLVTNSWCNPSFTVEITRNADGTYYLPRADGGALSLCTTNGTLLNYGNIKEQCGEILATTDLQAGSANSRYDIGDISGGTWDAINGILTMSHSQSHYGEWPSEWTSTYTRQ